MKIALDTDILKGMTETQVYEVLEDALSTCLGEFSGVRGHEEQCRTITQVWKSLIKPTSPAEKG